MTLKKKYLEELNQGLWMHRKCKRFRINENIRLFYLWTLQFVGLLQMNEFR